MNSINSVNTPGWRPAAFCGLLCLLLAGCGRQAPSPSPETTTSTTPPAVEKTWTDIPVARPEDRVTVHYHRPDGHYDDANLWSWNPHQKDAGAHLELAALGRDGYGMVFQFDRAKYGETDRIGLIPRLGHNWDHKDGGDHFWTPSLGNEVWLLGGKNDVMNHQPDVMTPADLSRLDDRTKFFDADVRLGASYTPQATTFRLFAPTAKAVTLVLYDEPSGGKGRAAQPLQPGTKGVWETTVDGDLSGKFYAYSLDGPGLSATHEALDPYAVNTVANGARGRITDLKTPPRSGPPIASPTDMVIYEMHVRDFTNAPDSGVRNRGGYLGFTETGTHVPNDGLIRTALDHLSELGVTHVELLPVQDFENDEAKAHFNWGYITTAYFSPEGMYASNPGDDSRVRELKALVDALHARGIGVIMDVVYNHTASDAPFDAIAPGYYYRHLDDGSMADGSACGNEFRSEAPMARKLIVDSLKFWTTEYGIDGYRFDLMALIDQETMREAERELRAIKPGIVLFGEPWTAGSSPLQDKADKKAVRQLPVGAFNDDFRNALKGSPDGHDPGFIQDGSNREALKAALRVSDWFAAPDQSINYMTCHDNLVLWDKLKFSMPNADDQTLEDTMKLGYLALFTSQGVPFFQGGEEFARTKGGNNNSYDAPDAVNQVNWSFKRKHYGLFTYTRDVIALRKAHPVFRLRSREETVARLKFETTLESKTLMYTLDATGVPGETWRRVCVVLNSDGHADAPVALPEGQWTVALDENGATGERAVSGQLSVRRKSGLILYQR